jgi:hypothetical protein
MAQIMCRQSVACLRNSFEWHQSSDTIKLISESFAIRRMSTKVKKSDLARRQVCDRDEPEVSVEREQSVRKRCQTVKLQHRYANVINFKNIAMSRSTHKLRNHLDKILRNTSRILTLQAFEKANKQCS